jgi:rod shape-determining protein MreD
MLTSDRAIALRRGVLLTFAVLVVQVGVVSDLEAFEALGDLVLLLAIAAGSVGGADRGATYGFGAGLAYDLLLDTPFGLSALVYAVVGYGVGMAYAWVLQPRWWFHLVAAFVASVGAVVLAVGVSSLLGSSYAGGEVVRIAGVVSAWNVALMLPARRLVQWAVGDDRAERFRVAPIGP